MLIPAHKIVDTLLSWVKEQAPIYNSIIFPHYNTRKMNYFRGLQKSIADSSLPSIEVGPISDSANWEFVRVIGDTINLEIHITIANKDIEDAMVLESKLVSYTSRILLHPPHLRAQILGTSSWLMDSFIDGVQYGAAGYSSNIRVAKISWHGKYLEYLDDSQFYPYLQAAPNPR